MKFCILLLALTGSTIPFVALAHIGDHIGSTNSSVGLHFTPSTVAVGVLLASIVITAFISKFRRNRDQNFGAAGR